MGIKTESNPDLALRKFGTTNRDQFECLPEKLEIGMAYTFLKKGQRNYWFGGEIPLHETDGNENLSRPLASIEILEAIHYKIKGEIWTRGIYLVKEVYDINDPTIHFEGWGKPQVTKANRPGVGLAVMVYRRDKILLGLRKNTHGHNHFQFPGGHLEFNESLEDCALRETGEETGLVVRVEPVPASVTNDLFEEGKHYITIFMRAESLEGEPRVLEPNKCGGWKWYSRDNLPPREMLFLPIRNLINQGYDLFTGEWTNEPH